MPKTEPGLAITLPISLWRDLVFCLGPDGVGWGEHSVKPVSREQNFVDALVRIDAEVQERLGA